MLSLLDQENSTVRRLAEASANVAQPSPASKLSPPGTTPATPTTPVTDLSSQLTMAAAITASLGGLTEYLVFTLLRYDLPLTFFLTKSFVLLVVGYAFSRFHVGSTLSSTGLLPSENAQAAMSLLKAVTTAFITQMVFPVPGGIMNPVYLYPVAIHALVDIIRRRQSAINV